MHRTTFWVLSTHSVLNVWPLPAHCLHPKVVQTTKSLMQSFINSYQESLKVRDQRLLAFPRPIIKHYSISWYWHNPVLLLCSGDVLAITDGLGILLMTRYLCFRMPSEVRLSLLSILRQVALQAEKTKQQENWIVFSQTVFVIRRTVSYF